MNKILCHLFIIFLSLIATSCEKNKKTTNQVITVIEENINQPLYYTGIIKPIKTEVIPSPIDGVIVAMPFSYGEKVKKGQLLFTLSSTKFISDYKTALMQFLKTKNDFNISKSQLKEAEFLHQNELISDDDFKMKQSNFYSAQLAFLQARDALDHLFKQIHVTNIDLNDISITNVDKIKQVMNLQQTSENLNITSPKDGIVLAISKNDENKKINCGDAIKQGDVLAQIGEMGGLSVNIKVNELAINEIKLGQKVNVEGVAFEEEHLIGTVTSIDKQADVSSANLPTFNVMIQVTQLSEEARKKIYPGMSARVVIFLSQDSKIAIPIKALQEKDGQYFVTKWDAQTQKKSVAAITLSKTTLDKVLVQTGLKKGDQIVLPD